MMVKALNILIKFSPVQCSSAPLRIHNVNEFKPLIENISKRNSFKKDTFSLELYTLFIYFFAFLRIILYA